MHFTEAYCDSNKLVTRISKEFRIKVVNNILKVKLIYECHKTDINLFNELKGHLKCPYCYKKFPHSHKNDLVYSSYTSKNIKYGYLRSHNSKDHWQVCYYFCKHYKRRSTKSNTGVLRNQEKLTSKKLNKIIKDLKPNNNNKGSYKNKTYGHSSRIKNQNTNNSNNKSKVSNDKNNGKRVRKLKWEKEHRLDFNDDKEICAFYGYVKNIAIKYVCQRLYKEKKYGEKEIFKIELNDGSYISPSVSVIRDKNRDENYIKRCIEKDKKSVESISNKYFICICQMHSKNYKIHPYPDIIFNNGKLAIWISHR